MALYTVPNSNPVRTIDSFSAVPSANRIEPGGTLTVTCSLTCTNFLPGISYLGVFNESNQPVGVLGDGGGVGNQVVSPYTGPNTPRTGVRTFTFKIKDNIATGTSFYFKFGTGFPVYASTELIKVIAPTPVTPVMPSIPSGCYVLGSNDPENVTGNFCVYPLGQLTPYPSTRIIVGIKTNNPASPYYFRS